MRSLSKIYSYLAMTLCAGLLLVGACGGDDNLPIVDCDAVTVPTYAQLTILDTCTGCHASVLEGNERGGAPLGVDFDTYELAAEHAEHGVAEVYEGAMPPPGIGETTPQQRQDFYAWALCGTPQ
jgi:uncharacterized membrane protein